MAELDKGQSVSLEELHGLNPRNDRRTHEAPHREGRHHGRGERWIVS